MAIALFQDFLEIRAEQVGFVFVELEDRGVVLEDDEIFVAIEQAQAVDGGGVAVAGVVAHFELLARLVDLAKAHEVDAKLGARGPQLRIERDGLAIVGDAVVVAAVEHEMVGD